jgi:VanZ family protein
VFSRRKIFAWLPALFWMSFIFLGSTDLGSVKHTSRIIGPFLRWFNPAVTDETIGAIQFFIRKCGHFTEYAILGFLFWIALKNSATESRTWRWNRALLAIVLSALYAMTDEFHQSFISTRQGSIVDVFIDTSGATAAIILLWLWFRWRTGKK